MDTRKLRTAHTRHYNSSDRITEHRLKVFCYCRVSTDMQVQYGLSLDAQRSEIERYAADRGWLVAEIFVDGGFSAKNTDRPAFRRMAKAIKDADGSIAAVVVTKLDRLTRSLRDLCTINEDLLEPYGCNLVAIRDGINTFEPVSRMLLPFLAIIGQIERQNTSERVRATIQHIRAQGGHYGKVPFGFVYELLRTMQVHRSRSVGSEARYDKHEAYTTAYRLRCDGHTMPFIAARLNADGLRPLKAAQYTWHSVQDLLRSAVYHDRSTPRGLALYLKAQGHSLREICLRLAQAGHFPKRGGQWYPQTVKLLMVSS